MIWGGIGGVVGLLVSLLGSLVGILVAGFIGFSCGRRAAVVTQRAGALSGLVGGVLARVSGSREPVPKIDGRNLVARPERPAGFAQS